MPLISIRCLPIAKGHRAPAGAPEGIAAGSQNGHTKLAHSGTLTLLNYQIINEKMKLVPDAGFEPATFGLQNRCTTTVLIRQ